MRLVTRSDFDGLACGALLLEAGIVDNWMFAHPKDLQDGKVLIDEDDCLANVPYVEGCGLWFDHHSSEFERLNLEGKYKGKSDSSAPSCARVIYDYYGGREKFSHFFDDMMVAVDKVDSGNLTIDEVLNPTGWILVGFLMDPRTGLGRWRQFTIPNYGLMEKLMDCCRRMTTDEILALPDVKERIEVYEEQTAKFKEMVKLHTRTEGNVIITDLRGVDPIYTGNRFMIYALYPETQISVHVAWGFKKQNTAVMIGKSIIDKRSNANIGELCLKYGGGGHKNAGTCQIDNDKVDEVLPDIIAELNKDCTPLGE